MRRLLLVVASFTAVTFVLPVAAQTIFKSTMPDGKVLFGDRPAPGAVKVEESQPNTAKTGAVGATAGDKETLDALTKARQQRETAQDSVRTAEAALKDAEAARAAGKEPLPDERIGTAGGGSQLKESYFTRQRKLEQDVAKARIALEQARSGK